MASEKEFICAPMAAILTTFLTHPLNKLIYRQILEHSKLSSASASLSKEGPFLLFRGVLPPILQKVIDSTAMFGTYSTASHNLRRFRMQPRLEIFLSGAAAGTMEAIVMPFERIQLLLVHRKYQSEFKNTMDAFIKIGRQYGFKEYYRGLSVIWIRNASACSSFFLAKAEVKRIFGVDNNVYSEGFKNFCTGGVVGGFISVLVYPFKVMKVVYHRKLGVPTPSFREVISTIYNDEVDGKGVKNFYRGVWLNAARALLNWGIMNMSYEFFMTIM